MIMLIATVAMASCNKPLFPTAADNFAGSYTFTDNYTVTVGEDVTSSSFTGTFLLTKIFSDTVQMQGAWSTTGTVTGNTVVFNPCTEPDGQGGYITYSFDTGSLSGNTLVFTYKGKGSRKVDDESVPWETAGSVVAVKN